MNTTKYATTVREPNTVEPRPLEGLRSIPKPPAGYAPEYFVNEFAKEPVPEFVGYSAQDIERPGYKILSSWTPEGGVQLFIDHGNDDPFTMTEVRDLIATLQEALSTATGATEG
ncbi:hypothetical protein [Pseudarthrobacter sp. DSP2-3-2b1]|uniref:hypothetical protein n=1 Tax=Pseudarthrobacter sp. DSP2-3-2b1 TaxID=2804661 RepID=UPI003CF451A0